MKCSIKLLWWTNSWCLVIRKTAPKNSHVMIVLDGFSNYAGHSILQLWNAMEFYKKYQYLSWRELCCSSATAGITLVSCQVRMSGWKTMAASHLLTWFGRAALSTSWRCLPTLWRYYCDDVCIYIVCCICLYIYIYIYKHMYFNLFIFYLCIYIYVCVHLYLQYSSIYIYLDSEIDR